MEDLYYVESIKGELLDRLLERGYYRMGRFIFTTHTLDPANDGSVFPVYWLRYLVNHVTLSAKNMQLLGKNAHFKVRLRSFTIIAELEQLYSAYAASLPFKAAPTLQDNLQDVLNEVYDTHIIEVRHNSNYGGQQYGGRNNDGRFGGGTGYQGGDYNNDGRNNSRYGQGNDWQGQDRGN